MHFSQALIILTAAALLDQTLAHPGHDIREEISERNEFFKNNKRNLDHCSNSLKKRGMQGSQQKRREAAIAKARAELGLPQKRQVFNRDAETALAKSHLSTLDVSPTTSGVEEIIFGNSSCLLSPEVTIGPYYVSGEYIRQDIRESQAGVELILEAQFVDVNSCEVIPELTWDIWHCNSTGVYSGVVASGNGDSTDESNLDKTFLRGLTTTDSDGIAQFITTFPGHYTGRATHAHVVGYLNGTVLDNGTYSGGSISHIGQLFFDQDLITEVERTSPYSSNTQTITTNAEDSILSNEAENESDPVVNYVLLGETVADGIFAWISIGVDSTAAYTGTAAATLTADGGVENESSGMGGEQGGDMRGAGGPPGSSNGTAAGWNGTSSSNSTSAASGSTSGTAVINNIASTSTSTSGSAVSSVAAVAGAASKVRSPAARFFFF